jgi:hypothetical protein
MSNSVHLQHTCASARPFVAASRPRHAVGRALPPSPEHQGGHACRSRRQRWWRCPAVGGSGGGEPGGEEGQGIDIDALAAQLGAEAERLRRLGGSYDDKASQRPTSIGDGDGSSSSSDAEAAAAARGQQQAEAQSDLLRPFGYEVRQP